jgi:protein-disulfide isomerase
MLGAVPNIFVKRCIRDRDQNTLNVMQEVSVTTRRYTVYSLLAISAAAFAVASAALVVAAAYIRSDQPTDLVNENQNALIRPHSPVLGEAAAPVTIVEFMDPSCEACRAFFPVVESILASYPKEVKLVLRYAPFHGGSEEAVRVIEASRKQGKFEEMLKAIFIHQPEWAAHDTPLLKSPWDIAKEHGLDIEAARKDAYSDETTAALKQDQADGRTLKIDQTPTFFVNGKPLSDFGVRQLQDLVGSEVETARK